MPSLLVNWVMKTKLEVTLEEANRLRLHTIDLRSHGLDTLPIWEMHCSPAHVKTIKCLLLQLNHLTEFSRVTCHTLESLKALTLDYNNLEDLPFDLRNFTNLTMLNVSHNNFSSLHFFYVITTLKNLRVLWANATGLEEIPREIEFLKTLRILGLRRNSIRRLPKELFTLRKLQWMTMSHNLIREVPGEIVNLRQLVHLNLSWNRLMKLPLNFNSMEDLQYVFLEYNRLVIDDDLTKFIGSMPNLKCCWVAGNLPDPSNPDYVPIQEIDRRGDGPNDTPVVNLTPWSVSTQSLLEQNDDESSFYTSTSYGSTIPVITSMNQMRSSVVPPPNPVGSSDVPGLGGRQCDEFHRRSEVDTNDLLTVYRNINDPKISRYFLESTPHEIETTPSMPSRGTTNVSRWSLILPDQSEGSSGESPVDFRSRPPQREHGRDGANILGNPENVDLNLARVEKIDEIERANFCLENGSSSDNMYRMARIHEWVTRQADSILADKTEFEGDDNAWSKFMINNGNSAELLEEANDTSMTKLFKEIEGEVNSIFKDAAAECQQLPFPETRRSMTYLSRQSGRNNKSDLQFIEGVQVSFHSRRSVTLLESTANDHTGVPTNNGNLLTKGENSSRDPDLYSANDVPVSGLNDESTLNGNDIVGAAVPVGSEELRQLVSALWSQGDDTDSTNYAPSDWENSAPSSAIDDQDFASRFDDVNLEEEEETRREFLLGDFDILNMIRHIIVLPS